MKPFQIFVIVACIAGSACRPSASVPPSPPPAVAKPEPAAVKPEPAPVAENKALLPLIDAPVAEMKLSTGRVLHDVMALTFAETAVSVTHRDGKQIIPYDQFPLEYRQILEERKPKPKVPDPKDEARKARLAREKEQKKLEQEYEARAAAGARQAEEARAATNAQYEPAIHERVARSYAYRFFNAKYDPTGSGTAYITDISIETNSAEAVSGWDGRYRVSGTASYRLYESGGRSMNQGSRRFEVITERKGNDCRVIDFSIR